MRTMAECERAALERRAADRWVTEAFCRPAEPEEQKKYRAAEEIVLTIRMTLSSSPIIRVRMPDYKTCWKAIAQVTAELNPAQVHCSNPPATIVPGLSNMKPVQDDTCRICLEILRSVGARPSVLRTRAAGTRTCRRTRPSTNRPLATPRDVCASAERAADPLHG
jgi:hypothetical protein